MTKVHCITIMVVDHDNLGEAEIKTVIENQKYPNWCIHPKVMGTRTREIKWHDDHPLNLRDKRDAAFERMFFGSTERRKKCPACGKLSRITTAGCDHCDLEDK